LIDENCECVICDFGFARGVDKNDINMTEYVVTRIYRAPEIMLSSSKYNHAVDI
jgi:mitogen-activated protein kinase 1/3